MSANKLQFSIADVEAAKESLAVSIYRLPPSIQGWPKHVLEHGSDEQIVKFANDLCRPVSKELKNKI